MKDTIYLMLHKRGERQIKNFIYAMEDTFIYDEMYFT